MDSFAPEFSRCWLPAEAVERAQDRSPDEDEAARREQRALEELAERVTAARTIV